MPTNCHLEWELRHIHLHISLVNMTTQREKSWLLLLKHVDRLYCILILMGISEFCKKSEAFFIVKTKVPFLKIKKK